MEDAEELYDIMMEVADDLEAMVVSWRHEIDEDFLEEIMSCVYRLREE